ncbi:hypothetical protein CTI12_AA524850 [Artemisia annua]|uniref:Reverse transcriptase zinc-binding domain-containing protein n=1 Tax=Artemisia annua TaxID=35608 RepID=A0A2U1L6L3_ARTAN|nr:hypothetical protein CTI12_AA524850 [Artemisia annua]
MATHKSILEQFKDASGLKLNWDKCQLFGINVSLDELSSRVGIINCKADVLPMSYLGFPTGSKGAKSNGFGSCIPKSEVWNRLIMLRYGSKSDWAPINSSYLVSSKISRTWKDILGFKLDDIGSLSYGPKMWKWEIRDCCNIRFWEDYWAFSDPIRQKFPHLFLACSNKRGKVNEFWIADDACWAIPFNLLLVRREYLQYSQLIDTINSFRLMNNINVKLIWLGNSDGVFKVHDAIKCLSSSLGRPQGRWIDFVWKSFAPPKVKIFMWTIKMNGVPTKEFLKIKGVKFKD